MGTEPAKQHSPLCLAPFGKLRVLGTSPVNGGGK